MAQNPWVKFYPTDWLGAVGGMSPAERGVYITLLALMYKEDGPIRRDDSKLARRCGCPKAAFVKTLDALIDEGKVTYQGGFLSNDRAEKEIVDRQKRSEKARALQAKKTSVQKEKTQQNQSPSEAQRSALRSAIPDNRHQKSDIVVVEGPEFYVQCMDFVGLDITRRSQQSHHIKKWQTAIAEAGLTDNLIVETLEAVMRQRNGEPPNTMKYFDQPIADAIATALSPMPKGKPNGKHARKSLSTRMLEASIELGRTQVDQPTAGVGRRSNFFLGLDTGEDDSCGDEG